MKKKKPLMKKEFTTGYEKLAAAVRHRHRLMILKAIATGASTFPEIRRKTQLEEAHIRYAVGQLEKAGWITKRREMYPVVLEMDRKSFNKLEAFQRELQIPA